LNQDKNNIQSIKQRLKNIAEQRKISFDYVMLIYMNEGMLRRLEASRFSHNIILKGGFLLSSMFPNLGRTTRDLDFLGINIANDVAGMMIVFSEICSVPCDDSLVFLTDNMSIEEIKEDNVYSGIRITVPCLLDKSRHILQVDVGYGDRITPGEMEYSFPVVLQEKPICLYVYPIETVIAEKFEAMITLDRINSRMKDFFDLYTIFQSCKPDKNVLFQAVKNTFTIRKTSMPDKPAVFTPEFYNDFARLKMWSQFLKRIDYQDTIIFQDILSRMRINLEPLYTELIGLK
jgi:hypothetical protein